jgi:hypothetical protein
MKRIPLDWLSMKAVNPEKSIAPIKLVGNISRKAG